MLAQNGEGLVAAQENTESTSQQPPILRRHRNSVASPLLRLPRELILNIFERAIEPDDDDDSISRMPPEGRPAILLLTAICHELREVGITTPKLWGRVDLTVPSLANLFLQRCNYDPHVLEKTPSAYEKEHSSRTEDPNIEAVWSQLEGRAFKNLRSLVFRGTSSEFGRRVAPILQTATNLSSLELRQTSISSPPRLSWYLSSPNPHFSILRLYGFPISWTSPLLRNLTQLTLDLGHCLPPSEYPPLETFLTTLANCPELESLKLVHAGPGPPNGHRYNCDVVVQLRRLRELFLDFEDASTVGCILSHVKHPESTRLKVEMSVGRGSELSETISQVLLCAGTDILQRFQRASSLTIHLCRHTSWFSTNKSTIRCRHWGLGLPPQALRRTVHKFLEFVGRDIILLSAEAHHVDLTNEIWEILLHAYPRLEWIVWQCGREGQNPGDIDPFIAAFSLPFEGGLVCPKLAHLELPRGALAQDSSATSLKNALTERDARGVRLESIGLSDASQVEDGLTVLEQFRDLVDMLW